MAKEKVGYPKLHHTLSEGMRMSAQFMFFHAVRPVLNAGTPDGFGEPVLVIPGFGAGDLTTKPLRMFLEQKNYTPYGWNCGINVGPRRKLLDDLSRRFHGISKTHGGRRITLIGHSLGGIYARELARSFPDQVSQVITLGSPFGMGRHPEASVPLVRAAFELLNYAYNPFSHEVVAQQALVPPPVPTTAIYTRSDGVVHWRTCINPDLPQTENIGVRGSHCGLIVSPASMLVIADRLAHGGSGQLWKPFNRLSYASALFPSQSHHGRMPEPVQLKGKPVAIFRVS